MATIRVHHDIGDLANDLASVAVKASAEMAGIVRRNVTEGNRLGKRFAKENSGAHGKHFPNAWTSEMTGTMQGEYGPDATLPQGNMDFELGSGRQSRPHLNAARSFDIVAPKFGDDVSDAVDRLLW